MVTNGTTPPEENEVVKTKAIPQADIDLMDVAKLVSTTWQNNPLLILLWLTQPDFAATVASYASILMERKTIGGTRREYTQKMKLIDKKINSSITFIKEYLITKYGLANASSYYEQFGMVHVRSHYTMPTDRNDRKAALVMMLDAITLHGFDAETYGHAYWSGIKTEYDSLLDKAETIDGSVSIKVGDKNVLKKQIRKALNALINLLKANYPDTYKTVMRDWGFQKEKY